MTDTVTIPAASLKAAVNAIGKLNTLVPLTKGQVAEVYVVIFADTKTGAMRMEHYRNGLRIRYKIDGARVESTLPGIALCIEHSFFNAIKKDGDVVFTREPNSTALKFQQGSSKGSVALTPPSEFKSPNITTPESMIKIPVDVVRAGLNATVFTSQDPTMSATGVLSSVYMRGGELSIVTFDSMCGAIYKRAGDELPAEIPEGFELTLPNQMMSSILGQADAPEIAIGVGHTDLCFRTPHMEVIFPRSEYPILPVATMINRCVDSADMGFTIDVAELAEAVSTNATYLNVDKDATNLNVEIGAKAARISVKSAKINHQCLVPLDNFKNKPFNFSCDVSRLQTFVRLVKGAGRLTVLFANHRIIFKVPGALYAFVES